MDDWHTEPFDYGAVARHLLHTTDHGLLPTTVRLPHIPDTAAVRRHTSAVGHDAEAAVVLQTKADAAGNWLEAVLGSAAGDRNDAEAAAHSGGDALAGRRYNWSSIGRLPEKPASVAAAADEDATETHVARAVERRCCQARWIDQSFALDWSDTACHWRRHSHRDP